MIGSSKRWHYLQKRKPKEVQDFVRSHLLSYRRKRSIIFRDASIGRIIHHLRGSIIHHMAHGWGIVARPACLEVFNKEDETHNTTLYTSVLTMYTLSALTSSLSNIKMHNFELMLQIMFS
jgi:hypothetical protein